MIWSLLLFYVLVSGDPITIAPPAALSPEGWSIVCDQMETITWSTVHPPERHTYGGWCDAIHGPAAVVVPQAVTLQEPEFFNLANWQTWADCMSGPANPIAVCRQSDYLTWTSNREQPEHERYDAWCYTTDTVHPMCLEHGYDQDADGDIDLKDWAVWTRNLPVDTRYEIRWGDRTWRPKWDQDTGTLFVIELP